MKLNWFPCEAAKEKLNKKRVGYIYCERFSGALFNDDDNGDIYDEDERYDNRTDDSPCNLLSTNVVLGNVLIVLQRSFLTPMSLRGKCH